MSQVQENIIMVDNPRVIKVLNKRFTKQILNCFTDTSKTAAEIASSVSFPKEKIYYHIKNLLDNEILFIADTEIVKGIEQKKFLPTAKEFEIKGEKKTKIKITKDQSKEKKQEEENRIKEDIQKQVGEKRIEALRKINERRRSSDKRLTGRREKLARRKKKKTKFSGKDNRSNQNRRQEKENRKNEIRRDSFDRRFIKTEKDISQEKKENIFPIQNGKHQSIKYKNTLLNLNGVNKAITFVHSGNNVTFLQATLGISGFQINRINNYQLPIKIKNHEIRTLPELIMNVYQQFINKKRRKKIYLAIHSDDYQCEMTYVSARGRKEHHFKRELLETLNQSYSINKKNSYIDYTKNPAHKKNTVVCYSSKKAQINQDYKILTDAGLQPRYNTSMPKILHNIYTYYNLDKSNSYALLIYIDRNKTHSVLTLGNQVIESRDFPKGLNHFIIRLSELAIGDVSREEAISNALHFLTYYGIESKPSKTRLKDGFSFNKAQSILSHLSNRLINELKDSIDYFSNVLQLDGYTQLVISDIYLAGPGSHIKNFGEKISDVLGIPVNHLDTFNTASLKRTEELNKHYFSRIRGNYLIKKKNNSNSNLESVKKKIAEREKAIETSKSPESAKYRLARLEIEKSSKLKSIDTATKKLIKTAKEFKDLKVEYVNGQETLTSDLEAVTAQLDDQSEILLEKYKEYDYLIKKISELEYESDHFQRKKEEARKESKGRYESQIKAAARSRVTLTDRKERYDQEMDDQETKILKFQEALQAMNVKLENGHNEVAVFEYLKEAIQNTANAFKRSFLAHLKSINSLTKEDLNTLQQAGYLLAQNTKRLNQIKESFANIVSGDTDYKPEQYLDGENGIETRKKLLDILDMVRDAPHNLDQLKNLTATIVKLNIGQEDLKTKKERIQIQIKGARKNKKEEKGALEILKKELGVHENDVKEKDKKRREILDILGYTRETMEMIHELINHSELLKELKPQQQSVGKELKELKDQLIRLNSSIVVCEQMENDLDGSYDNLNSSYEEKSRRLNDQRDEITLQEEDINNSINEHSQKEKSISLEINNAIKYIDELKKQGVQHEQELENLNQQKRPLVHQAEKDKSELQKELNKKLKELDKEKDRKIAEVEKTRDSTIKTFFKKELLTLEKKQRSIQTLLARSTKEIEKLIGDRNRVQASLIEKKKKKMPQIADLQKQIKGWQRDLKRTRTIQERLDALEVKRNEWDDLLEAEKRSADEQINNLEKSIKRKRSDSYHRFLQESLTRLNNEGDLVEIAKKMAEDSIAMDQEEITKVSLALERFKKRYGTFTTRYRKNHKEIMIKLRPLGGRRKTITARINNAQRKIDAAEKIVQSLIDKLDQKNKMLSKKEGEFLTLNEKAEYRLNDIQLQIDQIPEKESRAREEVDFKKAQQLAAVDDKKHTLENETLEAAQVIDDAFQDEDLIIDVKKLESRMQSDYDELENTKVQIDTLEKEQEKIVKSISKLKGRLKNTQNKLAVVETKIRDEEDQFQVQKKQFMEQMDTNKKELSQKQEYLLITDQKIEELELHSAKLVEEFDTSESAIKELNKKIMVSDPVGKNEKRSQKNTRRKSVNTTDQLQYLTQMEKDLSIHVTHSEKSIKELNHLLDTMRDQESSIQSSISLLENDLEYYATDYEKVIILIESNDEHLQKIGIDHRNSLNSISNVKDIYPAAKTILNERVDALYTLIELKTKELEELDLQLRELEDDLKEKRVEVAMFDQELSKINKDMKHVLEYSIYDQEQEPEDEEWKWEIAQHKMQSYMDLAQIKTHSKELFNEIIAMEQTIANYKNQQTSINHMIAESERISQKKIKRMEEACTRLELQITKEKNEIENLEMKVKELKSLAFNYGGRIETLEKELKNFREQEVEYELMLKDLDRSLESIQNKSARIIMDKSAIKENTLELDYMANLGLLMDPYSKLNLLPDDHKEDYRYFPANRILQNSLLALLTVFSLAAYTQRSRAGVLESKLPVKQSELSLLNMRQEMKEIVQSKNTVANTFSKLIYQDKKISSEMVLVLKYLSNMIPGNFNVTELKVDKVQVDPSKEINKESEHSSITITVKGFYDKNLENASALAESFRKDLESSSLFKKVNIGPGKKLKKLKTAITMSMVY